MSWTVITQETTALICDPQECRKLDEMHYGKGNLILLSPYPHHFISFSPKEAEA